MTKKKGNADYFVALVKSDLKLDIVKEYRFHPTRRWRFDYAIPSHKIAIEVEGGVWIQGRHTRGSGFIKDMEKYNAAAALGWRLIRVTPQNLITNQTLDIIKEAIQMAGN